MGTPSFRSLCRIAPRERGSRPWPGAPGHVPPAPPACGPTPCPPCAAAVPPPARPACGSPGNVAAKAGQARPGQVGRLRCSGAPFRAARPSPQAGRFAGLASLLPLAGCGVGAPARPGPHDVGAMGPSAPPARAAALRPALPARPRLRRRPCHAALPALSPHGVAAPRGSRWPASGPRQAAPRALAPLRAASSLRGWRRLFGSRRARAAIYTAARTGGASAAFPALRARRGAGVRRLRAGCRPVNRPARPRQAPCRPGKPGHDQRPCLPVSRAAWETVAGVPPSGGSPPVLHSVFGGAFHGLVGCRLSCVSVCSCALALGSACSRLRLCPPLRRLCGRFWLGPFSVSARAFRVPCGGSAGFLCRRRRVGCARWLVCRCAAAVPVCPCAGVSACLRSGRGRPCGWRGPLVSCAGLAVQGVKKAPLR